MFRQTDKLTVSLNEIIFEGDERNIRIEDTLVMADPYSFVDHYIHKEELIRRDKFLNTEYPIVKSIQELKKYNRVKEMQAKCK